MDPQQTEFKRNKDGTFAVGTAAGPGRPPGISLKEYVRNKFYSMSEEEREELLLQGLQEHRVAEERDPHLRDAADLLKVAIERPALVDGGEHLVLLEL